MKIWLIKQGEELPIDPGNPRLPRTGILAKMLMERGHQVTYWTSTFSHSRKIHRFHKDTEITISPDYRIKLLHSPGYKSNVSLGRIYDHIIVGRKFGNQALKEQKPDIIHCAMPTIELSRASTRYGKLLHVPTVLDMRDMWPDLFLESFPSWANGLGRLILYPMFKNLIRSCQDATAIFGITEAFLEWGLKYAGRKRGPLDAIFYHGYIPTQPNKDDLAKAESFWKNHGLYQNSGLFVACFFGYFGRQFEMGTVLAAAKKLEKSVPNIRFVLCGNGDNFEHYKSTARNLKNVIMPGLVGHPEIWTLMRLSSIGLAPYKSTPTFIGTLPNKVGEYLSAGLPIISSLTGTLENLLLQSGAGLTFKNMDVDHLCSMLINLYNHPENLRQMSDKAFKLFQERFMATNVYDNMIKHLESIAAQR